VDCAARRRNVLRIPNTVFLIGSGCNSMKPGDAFVVSMSNPRRSLRRPYRSSRSMDLFVRCDAAGSRRGAKPVNESEYIECPACAAQITLDRSPTPHIDECGFENYRFECQQCGASLAGIIDPCDESLLVSQPARL
jgi:hypothetical protein